MIESWLAKQPLLQKVISILQAQHLEAYLVGGAVRDLLLGREEIVDLDFAVPNDGLTVARRVANALKAAFYPLDEERGTGRVVCTPPQAGVAQKTYLDFATFRGPTLLTDLTDRDFTINAIALRLSDPPELIDPLHGQQDLAWRQIRAASEQAFRHDPVRVLRAVRQAADFGFTIEAQTVHILRQATSDLTSVSPERQRDELVKLLNTPTLGQAMEMLQQFAILPQLLPEVEAMVGVAQSWPHYLDVFQHTTEALRQWQVLRQQGYLPNRSRPIAAYLDKPLAGELTLQKLLPLAIFLHDSGKPLTQTIEEIENNGYAKIRFLGHEHEGAKIARRVLNRFHFSGQATSFVETVVAHHMRPLLLAATGKVSRRAIYRFFRDTSQPGYEAGIAIALLALADQRATYPPHEGEQAEQTLLKIVNELLTAYFDRREQVVDPPPLLTGQDLIKVLDLEQGPLIGLLLRRLKEAQATGQVTDRAAALAFVAADPDFINYREKSDSGGLEG